MELSKSKAPVCNHEIDESTLTYHPKYGRIGYCKKCGCKMYRSLINEKPKARKDKLSKKEKKQLRKLRLTKKTNPQSS